jgi:hydroxymethylpyrimidine/phosphomethylpyrimidine kinase
LSYESNILKSFSKKRSHFPVVLVIAGSDSSGGAGIQVDLRMLGAMSVHGVSAITAVTAQSSRRVLSAGVVSARQVAQQMNAALEGFDIGAVKIGMLGSASNIRAVAAFLRDNALTNIVLDPVLISSSGMPLLPASSLAVLRERLIPLVDVLTPNLPEAALLLGRRASGVDAAQTMLDLGAKSVLLKGGHSRGRLVDYFADSEGIRTFPHERLPFQARGTGCALSSAIAARLARGDSNIEAVTAAEAILQSALRNSTADRRGPRLLLVSPSTNK